MTDEPNASFESLLEFVREARGFDYTDYKRPSLMRRFQKRMEAVGAATYDDYRGYLEGDGNEFGELFNTILINVTGFFRDPASWQVVAEEVLPRILQYRPAPSPIRIWSAGCATGEEAYTAAMLLVEAIGEEQFRERAKIYATDVDLTALSGARTATYSPKQLEDVPGEFRDRYFTEQNGSFAFRSDIRRAVIFGRNDLLQDPPISRVDLLVCRNTLMYFEPDAQERVLANFAFAMHRLGFLMVGKAEALQSRTTLFEPYDLKRRIFVANPTMDQAAVRVVRTPRNGDLATLVVSDTLKESLFEHGSQAQVIVDPTGAVASINQAARSLFGLRPEDVGRPLQDLELSYRPVELRSLIDQVQSQRRPVNAKEVTWETATGDHRTLDVQVGPLTDVDGALAGIYVSFADVTRFRMLQEDLERARRDLETAYEELQSTVEELETMNEELQSTNEELEAMNDELRDRTDEALTANSFLGSVLWSIDSGIVVVDRQLRVTTWSAAASELWGLREDEVRGEHFLNLDFGLDAAQLREPIRSVLRGEPVEPLRIAGHNRRGHPIVCEIAFTQLRTHLDEVTGVILVMSPVKERG